MVVFLGEFPARKIISFKPENIQPVDLTTDEVDLAFNIEGRRESALTFRCPSGHRTQVPVKKDRVPGNEQLSPNPARLQKTCVACSLFIPEKSIPVVRPGRKAVDLDIPREW